MLTQEQEAMLNALKEHYKQNNTTVWIGNKADLNKIGGQEVLYSLEQAGIVFPAHRVQDQWFISLNDRS
jgi:hypothetical protein